MVEGISGSSYQYQSSTNESKSLTDDQKATLQDILANYDVENMSEEDKKSMFDELKESGIGMSKEVAETLEEAGFVPPEKPEDIPEEEESSDKSELLKELLEKVQSGEISEDEISSLIKDLQDSGETTTGVFLDKKS